MVGVFAIVAFLVVIALIIWRVSSSSPSAQNKSSSAQSTQQSSQPSQSNANEPSKAKTKEYTSSVGGYTFSYPQDWTLEASPGASGETTTLKSPDLVTKANNIGGYSVTQGAVITVTGYPCSNSCDLSSVYTDIYKYATDRSETTVDTIPAARFVFGYETPPQLYTVFFKNNYRYAITFDASGTVTSSPLLPIYTDTVVKSFKPISN
jgi:hypothetical protein